MKLIILTFSSIISLSVAVTAAAQTGKDEQPNKDQPIPLSSVNDNEPTPARKYRDDEREEMKKQMREISERRERAGNQAVESPSPKGTPHRMRSPTVAPSASASASPTASVSTSVSATATATPTPSKRNHNRN